MDDSRVIEEEANEILEQDARRKGKSLRKSGILNDRNLRLVHRREVSLEGWQQQKERHE